MTHSTLGAWRKPVIEELPPSDFKERKVYKDYIKSLSPEPDAEILSPEFSEDRLALRFASRHGNDLRYVAAWGKWFAWVGTHWRHEDTLAVFDMARDRCECGKNKEASASVLFASWKDWTEYNGEFTGTARAFGQKLEDHEFEHGMGGALYRGLDLAEAERQPWTEQV